MKDTEANRIKFLKENGVFSEFCENVRLYPFRRPANAVAPIEILMMSYDGVFSFLLHSFVWGTTPEGVDFWSQLDDEYCKLTK